LGQSARVEPWGKDRELTELNFSSIAKIIGKSDRRKLLVFSTLRVLANGLDIVGIAGIALLATAFGSFASGGQAASAELPVIGELYITESEAVVIALVVAIVFVSKSGFSILLNLRTSLFVAKIESRLSNILARDFFQIRQGSMPNKTSVSDFQNIAMSSTSGIRGFLNSRILLYSEGSLMISLLVVFLVVSPTATLVLTVFMGLVLYLLNRLINLRLKRNGQRRIEGSRQGLESARDLHGIKREAQTAGIIDQWLNKFFEGRSQMANASAIIYTLNTLPRFVIETSLILGIFMFIGGVVVFSDIPSQAVTIGVFLAGGLRIMASIIPFQGAITGMRSGAATGQFAFNVLQSIFTRTETSNPLEASNEALEGELSFKDVYFSYGEDTEEVLRGVSFHVEPNTKVAIVGPSGAGKSTIFELAMGFLIPEKGEVLVGNQTTRNALINSPGFFAVVPQRPHLVSGSVLENVSLLSDEKTDQKRVREVLIRAGLKKLTTSPDWQTKEIRPDSGQLSGGEIQRLSLARALYRSPKILFLDEATSALDAETELEISNVLDNLKKDMTVVLIAHRLSTVKLADKIIYLDKGQIVAEGTFKELKMKVKDFARAIEIMGLEDS
jgi:ATP-binding cassette subfamily C protein